MTLPVAVWHVVARLCMALPTAPEGFACETFRWQWIEGQPHQIEDAGHDLLHWRDVQMFIVLRPGTKPAPTSERPADAIGRKP